MFKTCCCSAHSNIDSVLVNNVPTSIGVCVCKYWCVSVHVCGLGEHAFGSVNVKSACIEIKVL